MEENSEIRKIRTACPQHCGIDACGILAHVESSYEDIAERIYEQEG